MQALLVTFAGSAFHVYGNYGLTLEHWALCLGIGSLSVPINFLLKIKYLPDLVEEKELHEKSEKSSEVFEGMDPTKE
mgnify:CR=1 FL=1